MEHVDVRATMIFREDANGVTVHLDNGWRTQEYSLNVYVCKILTTVVQPIGRAADVRFLFYW